MTRTREAALQLALEDAHPRFTWLVDWGEAAIKRS
jgi:hypothetical protein